MTNSEKPLSLNFYFSANNETENKWLFKFLYKAERKTLDRPRQMERILSERNMNRTKDYQNPNVDLFDNSRSVLQLQQRKLI